MTRLSRERTAAKKAWDSERLPRAEEHLRQMEMFAPTADADCRIQKNANGRYMVISGEHHPIHIGVGGDTVEEARRNFSASFGSWVLLARLNVEELRARG